MGAAGGAGNQRSMGKRTSSGCRRRHGILFANADKGNFSGTAGGRKDPPRNPAGVRRIGTRAVFGGFSEKDPSFAFTDPQRVLRAAEVLAQTGKSVTYWQSLPFKKEIDADFLCFLTELPRDELYRRCDERFGQMMRGSAVEEVRVLLAKNPPADSLVLKAIGVLEIKAFLNGEMTRDQAVDHACRMTRNYAKRQVTWFKHRFAADYVAGGIKSPDILTKALHFLE